MKKLTKQEVDDLEQTIASIEKDTDSELVTVIAKRSDNYLYIPALWAAVLALFLPAVLKIAPFWLTGDELLLLQWSAFIVFAVVFRAPPIMMRLLPKSVKHWRASNMARRQFLDNNLHHTKDGTGLLIFVSEDEHYVEILADRGIDEHVDQSRWEEIVNELIGNIKTGNTHDGLLTCINNCGKLLKEHVPSTGPKNELPNRMVILN